METVSLSAAEKLLIEKMGLTSALKKLTNPPSERTKTPPPVSIKMEDFSGTVTTTCLCCGAKTVKYVDYVKRKDCEGYAVVTMEKPSHKIKRNHVVDTINCEHCQDNKLADYDYDELIKMVINLRKILRKGEK